MRVNPVSVEMIKTVALGLGELNERAVYVGGATVPFYLPEEYWPQARPTEDIDVVMEIMGNTKNWANEEELRKKGFQHDTSEGAPICRWIYKGLKVDVISSDESVFGFTNKWYKEGIIQAISVSLRPQVRIFSLPYFLGTKMEAFKGRGRGDYQASTDMEDIISVLEVAPEKMWNEGLSTSSKALGTYLKTELEHLKNKPGFVDALPGAIFNRETSIEATQSVIRRMDKIIKSL